jgi:hypothetical protein
MRSSGALHGRKALGFAILLATVAALGGCAGPRQVTAPSSCAGLPGTPMLSVLLYFGRDRDGEEAPKPGGGTPIPDPEWHKFLEDVVTPRFPDGFTVFDSYGQWRNPTTGIITHQRSAVINILTPQSPEVLHRLDEIREIYKQQNHHLSVGLALSPACAGF